MTERKQLALGLLGILILLGLLMFTLVVSAHAQPCRFVGVVLDWHDGDTAIVAIFNHGRPPKIIRVRLAEVDAPELDQPYGKEALKMVRRIAQFRWVWLMHPPKGPSKSYGRVVARMFVCNGVARRCLSVGSILVWHGLAVVDPRYCNSKGLLEWQEAAKKAKRGVWGVQDFVMPWEWRHMKKEGRYGRVGRDHNNHGGDNRTARTP